MFPVAVLWSTEESYREEEGKLYSSYLNCLGLTSICLPVTGSILKKKMFDNNPQFGICHKLKEGT